MLAHWKKCFLLIFTFDCIANGYLQSSQRLMSDDLIHFWRHSWKKILKSFFLKRWSRNGIKLTLAIRVTRWLDLASLYLWLVSGFTSLDSSKQENMLNSTIWMLVKWLNPEQSNRILDVQWPFPPWVSVLCLVSTFELPSLNSAK